jgi:hypothetical protein
MFYGYRGTDGSVGGPYFKQANSLSEALRDLIANPGVDTENELGYLVRDAFVEIDEDDGDPVIHVELVSLRQILEEAAAQ